MTGKQVGNIKVEDVRGKNGRRSFRATWWEEGHKHRSKTFKTADERRKWLEARRRQERQAAHVQAAAARAGDYVSRFAKIPPEAQNALLGAWDRIRAAGGDGSDVLCAADARVATMGGGVSVAEAVAAHLDFVQKRLRPKTVEERRLSLGDLSAKFGESKLCALTRGKCREWIEEASTANAQRHRYGSLSAFLNDCVRREWLGDSPMRGLKKPPPPVAERVSILSAREAERLLRAAERVCPRLVPFIALGLFAGVRPQREARWVRTEFLDLKGRVLYVTGATSKTHVNRDVPVSANLVAWLRAYPPEEPVFDSRAWRKKVREAAKVAWPPDVLRHTYASFRLAMLRDPARVADEMGHDVAVLKRHYANRRIPPADVKLFWAIRPQGSARRTEPAPQNA